jgi:hypothetical protein
MSSYRPFARQWLWFDPRVLDRYYQLLSLFPTAAHENYGFVLTDAGSHFEFCAIATDLMPNLHLLDTGKFFASYTYEAVDSGAAQGALDFGTSEGDVIDGYRRVDNITDETLTAYRAWYGEDVTKDGIFASRVRAVALTRLPGAVRRGPQAVAAAHPEGRGGRLRRLCRGRSAAARPAHRLRGRRAVAADRDRRPACPLMLTRTRGSASRS